MSNIVPTEDYSRIEALVLQGDLSKLKPEEKVIHYNRVCESVGLNPMTRPFDYMKFQGREILYARRDCADQLRKKHGISVKVLAKEMDGDLYTVTAAASAKDGRYDEDIGAVNVKGLAGEALANAKMKAMTKAKRRVTLSICGLGFLDETEVESMQAQNHEREVRAKELTAAVHETEERPEFESYSVSADEANPAGDFIFNIGKEFKGRKLKNIPAKKLAEFIDFVNEKAKSGEDIDAEVVACYDAVAAYTNQGKPEPET